jgi:hypothetical protein
MNRDCWGRQSASDASYYIGDNDNEHPDDAYSLLDNDDVTHDEQSVPTLIAASEEEFTGVSHVRTPRRNAT